MAAATMSRWATVATASGWDPYFLAEGTPNNLCAEASTRGEVLTLTEFGFSLPAAIIESIRLAVDVGGVPSSIDAHLRYAGTQVGAQKSIYFSANSCVSSTSALSSADLWSSSSWSRSIINSPSFGVRFIGPFSGSLSVDAAQLIVTYRTYGNLTLGMVGRGRVVFDPPASDCTRNCVRAFDLGEVVTMTATANPGYVFAGFFPGPSGGSSDCDNGSITMSFDLSCEARFIGVDIFADDFESGDTGFWSATVP